MFKQNTLKAFSVLAIGLSILGILISILGTFFSEETGHVKSFLSGILSWSFLLWSSIIAYKLCTAYSLYDEEYKKVGIRIYLIIAVFVLFFFVGLIIGLMLSVVLLSALWGLKHNYDKWKHSNPSGSDERTNSIDS